LEIEGMMPNEVAESCEAEPYEALARFYDRLMSHVDYKDWARFTLDLLGDQGLWRRPAGTQRVLECACGTGSLAMLLSRYGLKVDAFDRSRAMVAQAESKTGNLPNAPRFFEGTFANFRVEPPYDAALCLYDSINYLLEPEEFIAFLQRISGILRPGGLFLFDICTEINSILHFDERMEQGSGPGYRFNRTMSYLRSERIQENRFEIEISGQPTLIHERHRQRIFSLDEVHGFIVAAGLSLVEETDGQERRPPTESSLRVHLLCRKPKKPSA
jgi:SAM-dependent methyltransferase